MKTLYLERSVSSARDGGWVEDIDVSDVELIVVGTGPGSFAGVRAAIAFAQGCSVGNGCEVLALPSPCAIAGEMGFSPSEAYPEGEILAVVGDARRGKRWICIFSGKQGPVEVFQVSQGEVEGAVPKGAKVVSPDDARLAQELREAFGENYLGLKSPTSEGLRLYAQSDSSALLSDVRPIYLNPAVRD